MSTPTSAELLVMLARAEHREREALKETGAQALGDLLRADHERHMRSTFGGGNSEVRRDELRSEAEALRANDLELKRQLGDLTEDEEAERADLAARRTRTGYIKPATEPAT